MQQLVFTLCRLSFLALLGLLYSQAVVAASQRIYPAELILAAGETRQVVAQSGQKSLHSQVKAWVSSDPVVVSVSAQGKLTGGVQKGEAQITATLDDGNSLSAKIVNRGAGHYVYFVPPATWQSVWIYSFAAGGVREPFGPWPGRPMDQAMDWGSNITRAFVSLDDSALGLGLVFHNFEGQQTPDFKLQGTTGADQFFNFFGPIVPPAAPEPALKGTQIQLSGGDLTLNGSLNLSGRLFVPGQVLKVVARQPAAGEEFAGFEGSGARFLLNAQSAQTEILVGDEKSYTIFAVFRAVVDPFPEIRNTYVSLCAGCHGKNGGGQPSLLGIAERLSLQQITQTIAERMPPGQPGLCSGKCAEDLAKMLAAQKFLPPQNHCESAGPQSFPLQRRGLRLLTRFELASTLASLFPNINLPELSQLIPADFKVEGYLTDASAVASAKHIEGYLALSSAVAKAVAESAGGLKQFALECGENLSCVLETIGKKAFRRPLGLAENQQLQSYFQTWGIEGFVLRLLNDPYFLYRSEMGEPIENPNSDEQHFKLTDYEIATWLSYTILGTSPSDRLLDKAEKGVLSSADQIAAEIEYLFTLPAAKNALQRFITGWLELDAPVSAQVAEDLKRDFVTETLKLADHVLREERKGVRSLLLAPYSFLNDRLALHYGLPLLGADNWQKRELPVGDRKGILGHAQFLASHATTNSSHPVKRGLYVRNRLLCQEFPPPPVGAELKPISDNNASTRQRFESLHAREDCSSCHRYIDGVGFGLEAYSQFGLRRDVEIVPSGNRVPINAQGQIGSLYSPDMVLSAEESSVEFSGITELSELLAKSPNVRSCFARQVFRYANGFKETASDNCRIKAMQNGAEEVSFQDSMKSLILSPGFFMRK